MVTDSIRGATTVERIDFTLETCCACGIPFFMPTYLRKQKLANPGESFYCPNGHGQSYVGKTEADKLREKIDRMEKEKQVEEERLNNLYLDALNDKKEVEKQLKRLHRGVCPCCNRSFCNLQQHMKKQHPEHIK